MPDVTKSEADLWLGGRDDGYFLLRLSFTEPNKEPFTMSRRKGKKTIHRR